MDGADPARSRVAESRRPVRVTARVRGSKPEYVCRMRAHRIASLLLFGLSLAGCGSGSTGTNTGNSGSPDATSSPAGTTSSSAPATSSSSTTAPSSSTSTSSATATSSVVAGPYVLTSKQVGGIAALRMETVIDSTAKTISFGGPRNNQPQTATLTDGEVAEITRAVNDVGLGGFGGHQKSAVADAFTYELALKFNGETRTVSWMDGTTPPAPVLELRNVVTRLREAKFRGGTKSGPIQ